MQAASLAGAPSPLDRASYLQQPSSAAVSLKIACQGSQHRCPPGAVCCKWQAGQQASLAAMDGWEGAILPVHFRADPLPVLLGCRGVAS